MIGTVGVGKVGLLSCAQCGLRHVRMMQNALLSSKCCTHCRDDNALSSFDSASLHLGPYEAFALETHHAAANSHEPRPSQVPALFTHTSKTGCRGVKVLDVFELFDQVCVRNWRPIFSSRNVLNKFPGVANMYWSSL